MINVRPAKHDDIQAIADLAAVLSTPLSYDAAKQVFEAIEATPNHFTFVAEEDGIILGTYGLLVMQHFSHNGAVSAVINDVVVGADTQGRGVGTIMMQHATDFAIQHGCYKISLSSGKQRDLAHAFYRKLGYEQHGISFLLPIGN